MMPPACLALSCAVKDDDADEERASIQLRIDEQPMATIIKARRWHFWLFCAAMSRRHHWSSARCRRDAVKRGFHRHHEEPLGALRHRPSIICAFTGSISQENMALVKRASTIAVVEAEST